MSGWLPDGTTEWADRPVARSVADALPRCRATLRGTVVDVSVHRRTVDRVLQRAGGTWLDALLHDGTGVLLLRWLGRHEVPGLARGVGLTVEGTVSSSPDGLPMILNPLYRFGDPRPVDGR